MFGFEVGREFCLVDVDNGCEILFFFGRGFDNSFLRINGDFGFLEDEVLSFFLENWLFLFR